MKIHPSAIIHSEAQLADDVEVQPFSIIGPGVTIGAGTVVGAHCLIEGDSIIGRDNRIYSGAQIGIPSQDLKHDHNLTGRTRIGNNNTFREYVTVTASTVTSPDQNDGVTSIGDDSLLMTYVHVGHDSHIGDRVVLSSYVGLSGHVTIDDNANISGQSGIHQDTRIGTHAFVAGQARIVKDLPPFMIVEGDPCRCIGPNAIGLQRNGFDKAARARIKQMFKIVYRSHLNTSQALEEIQRSVEESDERGTFIDFIQASERGIIQ